MKILWLTNVPSPYRVDFFNELGKKCELTVLFEKRTSDERDKSWQDYKFLAFTGVFLSGKSINTDTAFCPSVVRYVKNRSYDHIVVTNVSSPTGMLAIQYMKLHRIQYWIEGDGGFAKSGRGIKEQIKQHYISGAKGYFSTSKAHDDYYITYGAESKRIYRYPFSSVHEGDILASPVSTEEKAQLKADLGMTAGQTVIGVGQMIARKGFDVLIRAAALIKDAEFYIIGGVPTKDYLKMKEELSANNVHFLGFMKSQELKQYYQAADLFVLPTREDIWGLVINEAMANGLPVITTDRCVAGLELVQNGENGYIVPVEDVMATVESIRRVLSADIVAMSGRSLDIIRNYTIEAMVETHMRILGEQQNE